MKFFSKTELKIFITFFIFYLLLSRWIEYSPFPPLKSLVEEGRIEIDSYYKLSGDRAYFDGHYYSDKPIGLTILFLPVYYFISRAFPNDDYFCLEETYNKGVILNCLEVPQKDLYSMIIFSSLITVFSSLSIIILYRILNFFKIEQKYNLISIVVFGFGTVFLFYSIVASKSIPSLMFMLLAFYLILKRNEKKLPNILAGFFAGFSLILDFRIFFILPILILLASKKVRIFILIGLFLGIMPQITYNFLIFGNPFIFTLMHIDRDIYPLQYAGDIFLSNFMLPSIDKIFSDAVAYLFYPLSGLFFFSPIFIISFFGFYNLYKKNKSVAVIFLSIFLINFIFLLFSVVLINTFGSYYLLYAVPFLIIPMAFKVRNISMSKNIFSISILLLLLSISLFNNMASLASFKAPVRYAFNYEKGIWETFEVDYNYLYNHYVSLLIKEGPRSRILEGLLYDPYEIDIRDFKPMPVREIKLFALPPFGILVLKIPFLIIPILLLIIILIWRKELFRIFIFKKIPVGYILLLLIALLCLSRLEFKDVVYDKNWYPAHVNATHFIEQRWMAEEAFIYLYSPKEEGADLFFKIGTFYEPRRLEITANGKVSDYFVTSSAETLTISDVPLKKGENIIGFKSLSGCDRPSMLVNGSNDYRCLSFIVHELSVVYRQLEYKIAIGKNWYPPEPNITWAYENPTILIDSAAEARAKLNLTLMSYHRPREVDFYVNNILFDTIRIEPYGTNVLTKTVPLRTGGNTVEFIAKERCDIPALVEKSDDKRCLSIGLIDIGLVSPFEFAGKSNLTFGPNWYEQEHDGRWMSNNASIFLFSETEKEANLSLEVASYYENREIQIYLNKVLVFSGSIPAHRTEITIHKVKLFEGENLIEIKTPKICYIPAEFELTKDERCISFKFFSIKLVQ